MKIPLLMYLISKFFNFFFFLNNKKKISFKVKKYGYFSDSDAIIFVERTNEFSNELFLRETLQILKLRKMLNNFFIFLVKEPNTEVSFEKIKNYANKNSLQCFESSDENVKDKIKSFFKNLAEEGKKKYECIIFFLSFFIIYLFFIFYFLLLFFYFFILFSFIFFSQS
jgi:hypothetical protein